ncbi:MAG TPA: hypothetical protein VIK61_19855 [Acidimicrobiia bacterium]
MSRFVNHSSRRLVAVLALATTTAVPALVVISGQAPASPVATTFSPSWIKMN